MKYGMGRHEADLSAYDQITSLKPWYASIVVYNLALFFTKWSIMLQYLRIFPLRKFRILCYCLMAFVFAWSCWTVFSAIAFCTPVEKFWRPDLPGHCLSEWAVWYASFALPLIVTQTNADPLLGSATPASTSSPTSSSRPSPSPSSPSSSSRAGNASH